MSFNKMSCCRKHKHRQALKEAVDKSRALVKQVMLKQGVPGAVVAVIKDGRLVWSEGVGLADVENDTPCTAESGEEQNAAMFSVALLVLFWCFVLIHNCQVSINFVAKYGLVAALILEPTGNPKFLTSEENSGSPQGIQNFSLIK